MLRHVVKRNAVCVADVRKTECTHSSAHWLRARSQTACLIIIIYQCVTFMWHSWDMNPLIYWGVKGTNSEPTVDSETEIARCQHLLRHHHVWNFNHFLMQQVSWGSVFPCYPKNSQSSDGLAYLSQLYISLLLRCIEPQPFVNTLPLTIMQCHTAATVRACSAFSP